jgi:O-antigen/teichoic acid export membrane protein
MMQRNSWLNPPILQSLSWARLNQIAFSIADQAFSVGGMFIANVALARTVSKEEYGMFALVYSGYIFLNGLHNAAILETYTVYGAGRYRDHGPEYRWLLWRNNALLGIALTILLVLIWRVLAWTAPNLPSRSLLGLALSSAILLTAALVRRMLYVQRKPQIAAKLSFVFFLTLLILLWLTMRAGLLNGLSVFLIFAVGWIVGGFSIIRELPRRISMTAFTDARPNHQSEHWKYARWVLATAFVFQLTNQGYYWVVAGFLSLREVAELRAIYLLVSPVDQVLAAITFLVLPMLAHRYASKHLSEFFSLWRMYLLGFILISGSFVLLVVFFGNPVIHLIYGGKFDEVSPLLGTLALLPLLMAIGNTMNAAMKSVERPNLVLYAYLASGVATFAAGIPLVIHFGVRGAVYGMLVSAGVYSATLGVGFLSFRAQMSAACGQTIDTMPSMPNWFGTDRTAQPENAALVGSKDE